MKCGINREVFLRAPFRSAVALTIVFLLASASGTVIAAADRFEPGDAKRLVKQAKRQVRRGDYSEAERLLREAIRLSPEQSAAKVELAYLMVRQRRVVDAYELALPVAKAEPTNARAFAVLGAAMLTAGRFADARTLFYTAINLDRDEALAWAGYGMLDFYENRIGESINNLREAVYHDRDEADFLFALAQVSARAERYTEAADAYKQFLVVSKNTDDERRARIKGLINFLQFLGHKQTLYIASGGDSTSVPIKLVGNRPIVQLRVNKSDEPLNFVLDTGSGISVVSQKTAKRLGIKPITKGGFAKGIGGDGKFEIVYGFVREVDIGEVTIRNVPVYIRHFHGSAENIDGYIGLSLISKFLTTLDYGELSFSLVRKNAEGGQMGDAGAASLPLRLTSSGFLSGEVQVEGVDAPLNFIVDTGASVSVISEDIASSREISQYARTEKMRVVGSAGVTDDVPSFLLPRVTFGEHSRQSITAIALDLDIINEASGFEQAGILGGNFLRNYRLTFDFRNSKVTFVPIASTK